MDINVDLCVCLCMFCVTRKKFQMNVEIENSPRGTDSARRPVIYEMWRAKKEAHGEKCWGVVAKEVNKIFHYNVTRMTVKRMVERVLETSSFSDRKAKRLDKAKRTEAIDKAVFRYVTNVNIPRHRRSLRELAKRQWCGKKLSLRTMNIIMISFGLRFLRSGVGPLSSTHHDRMRCAYGRMVVATDNYYGTVLVIDETHFETIHRPNRRNTGEWCEAGVYPEKDSSVKHPGRLNAAMGISIHGMTSVHTYTGRFNAGVFVEHLTKIYAPQMEKHGLTLLMDNDPSHHSNKAIAAAEAAGLKMCSPPPPPCWQETCECPIPELPWFPAYCPQLSPLEITFNEIQQKLDHMTEDRGMVKDLSGLKRRVGLVQRKISAEYIEKLFGSMKARCAAMVEGEGKVCRYG